MTGIFEFVDRWLGWPWTRVAEGLRWLTGCDPVLTGFWMTVAGYGLGDLVHVGHEVYERDWASASVGAFLMLVIVPIVWWQLRVEAVRVSSASSGPWLTKPEGVVLWVRAVLSIEVPVRAVWLLGPTAMTPHRVAYLLAWTVCLVGMHLLYVPDDESNARSWWRSRQRTMVPAFS